MLALPCPGCGLTRSITCISHLHFEKSLAYHPFGILIYSLFLANILLSITPETFNRSLRIAISQNERLGSLQHCDNIFRCFWHREDDLVLFWHWAESHLETLSYS